MINPTRKELEKHLGEQVEIVLFDNTIHSGILHKTNEKEFKTNTDLIIPINMQNLNNMYFVLNEDKIFYRVFNVSHIRFFNVIGGKKAASDGNR